MNIRWEVSESDWLTSFANLDDPPVDYVRLDLGDPSARPWLEEARERIELIGWSGEAGTGLALERALDLDVDFLCFGAGPGELDLRRLPLRLMLEEDLVAADRAPSHFGAAWARRIRDWSTADAPQLSASARRERIFLMATAQLPPADLLAEVQPFAVVAPVGTGADRLRALNRE